MATALAVTPLRNKSTREQCERLGAEITELCSYIYAAEHRFLTLIREFDEQRRLPVDDRETWHGIPCRKARLQVPLCCATQ